MEKKPYILFGFILSIGLVVASLVISLGLGKLKPNERYVTVRGLAERNVKSDLVIWSLKFKTAGEDLVTTQSELDKQKDTLVNFLKKEGFKEDEIIIQGIRLVDKQANEYSNDMTVSKRFVLTSSISVRTNNVELVSQTQKKISQMISSGVVLSDENYCGNMPNYLFTQLNNIKIDMLKEATQNARDAGKQFAQDAEAELGTIRRATQGYFSIDALDSVQEGSSSGANCGDAESIMKKVRVVSTVDFYLN